ncbi:metallophosphoesterase [Thermotoga sp. KOL6]|uniref:metallophosphoesterase n=1 Tax=Thermotoga sp. KOL6 TaxID=126741 RepID=UPI000C791DB7|nr:metallophosphoesterase [Thermotoga sp. KOL6]PLV59437.1 UDP-2,3-diacylglucosamine hydrolase [Thermotoga sp. KOL6]
MFLSDLHIGDGSAKDDFFFDEELNKFLEDVSEEPKVELFIVGDGFEILESRAVKELGLKPFEEIIETLDGTLMDEIERKHQKIFKTLRRFSKKHKIYYIVGNHDYHIFKNEKLQKALLERFEHFEILPYYYDHQNRLLVLHGNQFDAINRFSLDKKNKKIVPPLGDFIARYMMVNFDEHVINFAPKDIVRDYDNVRPLLDVFHWFEYVTEAYDLGIDLVEIWLRSFLDMLKTKEAKTWMKNTFPNTYWLSKVFVNRFGGVELGRILVRTIYTFRKLRRIDYLQKWAKAILKEKKNWKNFMIGYDGNLEEIDKVDILVMGHVHHFTYKIIPTPTGKKLYLNCGSWRPVLEKVGLRKKHGFHRKAELPKVLMDFSGDQVEVKVSVTNILGRI